MGIQTGSKMYAIISKRVFLFLLWKAEMFNGILTDKQKLYMQNIKRFQLMVHFFLVLAQYILDILKLTCLW